MYEANQSLLYTSKLGHIVCYLSVRLVSSWLIIIVISFCIPWIIKVKEFSHLRSAKNDNIKIVIPIFTRISTVLQTCSSQNFACPGQLIRSSLRQQVTFSDTTT